MEKEYRDMAIWQMEVPRCLLIVPLYSYQLTVDIAHQLFVLFSFTYSTQKKMKICIQVKGK